ncbi:hypothetical protein [Streptomyces werraensis]|uniref:hypothetical protein n=1 Tax=Streptomyces werraensis TaxID=68284 RepID=UPI00342E4298
MLTARAARYGTDAADRGAPLVAEGHGHLHSHEGSPRVAWLLVLPAAALLLFPPPALGNSRFQVTRP